MKQFSSNCQDIMAENFMLNDVLVRHYSYQALVKIQRWKYIMEMPSLGTRIQEEAMAFIQRSFFSYVSSTFVLLEEGFYCSNSEN